MVIMEQVWYHRFDGYNGTSYGIIVLMVIMEEVRYHRFDGYNGRSKVSSF